MTTCPSPIGLLIFGILIGFSSSANAQSVTACLPRTNSTALQPSAREVLSGDGLEIQVRELKASREFNDAVNPYSKVLDWYAEKQGDSVCVIGLFESPWGVRFVQDATVVDGRVYTSYQLRPLDAWVKAIAAGLWGLTSYYVRLTPAEALDRVRKSRLVSALLLGTRVIDGIAEIDEDTAKSHTWRFALFVEKRDRTRAVLVVSGLTSNGVQEGQYVGGYGFGNAANPSWDIPLYFSDWVHNLIVSRNWTKVTNVH